MTLSRRRFLGHTARLGVLPVVSACSFDELPSAVGMSEPGPFQHGVASGDPLVDGVILWTRVTAAPPPSSVEVRWRVARDPELTDIAAEGTAETGPDLDYTVKVDVSGLAAGTSYYYEFRTLGARSPVGRTRTLPSGSVERVRLALACCANYPAGYFSAYRRIAERADLDVVLHLGDYIYEYEDGVLGDGASIGRQPNPDREATTLEDYRLRHAQYKLDADLQELHRQHPLIAIWDDHEVSDNAHRDGAANHQPDSEGAWEQRKAFAMRAYFEWMPVRAVAPGDVTRLYRSFAFGDLFDLILLDTRYAGRDARVSGNCDMAGLLDPARGLLGAEQEAWLLDALRASIARGTAWRLIGQQVMMAQLSDAAEGCVSHLDQWDGYPASRARVLAALRDERIDNVVVLTGDAHSSWACDVAEDPFAPAAYDGETGSGSLAVEFVAPAVTSPAPGGSLEEMLPAHPHIKYAELTRNGYVVVDVTRDRARAEWYFVSPVREAALPEQVGAAFETASGQNHLRPATPSLPREAAPAPAP